MIPNGIEAASHSKNREVITMKNKKRIFLCCLMSLLMVFVMAVPMSASAAEGAVAQVGEDTYADLQTAFTQAPDGSTITVLADTDLSSDISFKGKNITLDINGKTVTFTGGKSLIAGKKAALTIKDSTVTAAPAVDEDWKITYDSGRLVFEGNSTAVLAKDGGSVTLESGTIDSAYLGLYASAGSTVTMEGGYVIATEFAVSPQGSGATANINGGVAEARDNAVLAGNGSNGQGGTVMNVSGGTLIGHIKTDGYTSCGIYHPQEGTLNVTGGTIYSENGCGILMRGGDLNLSGGVIIASGDVETVGKVGDSRVVVGTSGVVFDKDAGYYDAAHVKVNISGEAVVVGAKEAVEVIDEKNADAAKQVEVIGGAFSSNVMAFVPQDKVAISYYDDVEDETIYFVGTADEINEIVSEADDGDVITVLKGENVELEIFNPGVVIKNDTENDIVVNGATVKPEEYIEVVDGDSTKPVTPPSDKEPVNGEAEKSPETGDDSNLALPFALMALAGMTAAGTVVFRRRNHQ